MPAISASRWALGDLQRIHAAEAQASQEGGGVEIHVLEDAGHWLCFRVDTLFPYALIGCVFTKDINKAILISDAMETGIVQINSAPACGPDHFPFQGLKDSGIGSQGITNNINMMTKVKSTMINLLTPSYTME